MSQCIASVVGAGDSIAGAIARRFAREGYHVVARRRNGDKLAPVVTEIEADGGVWIVGRSPGRRGRRFHAPGG